MMSQKYTFQVGIQNKNTNVPDLHVQHFFKAARREGILVFFIKFKHHAKRRMPKQLLAH
ncbi:hypothetical protein [Pedobacter nyackensis]|uniref:hypothetical protein n=1 Tax=Pedobacter nyackensis TaxID=475255 RepID=UPI00292E9F0B|nr:hypothetical protein [Pedobacter nyackensis]